LESNCFLKMKNNFINKIINGDSLKELKKIPNENIIVVCADIEDQIMSLQAKDRKDFMLESGIKNTGAG